ncbi:MAG TPA: DegT/DnrJ/EryC1/StrS family aminotransferase [Dongiaceae bacterium]|nr:DegT/DnrJ/EryC1/StrS family aminotransferase [Dongiaceae bacterium]
MIPLHRPGFGLGTVLGSCLSNTRGRSLRRLEEAYTEASGGAWAVWLPSARAGIGWALRAALEEPASVIGPAFSCTVVHEAMVRSGGELRLLEPATGSFLMAPQAISELETGRHALVLCEVYGHTYDLAELERRAASTPAVRIVDMAMAVPCPALFQRLRSYDFGVISFGNGKSMYAGWGGIGFARERALAEAVRRQRDLALAQGHFPLLLRRALRIGLRTAAHYPWVYGLSWRLWYRGRPLLGRARRWWGRNRSPEPPPPGPPAAAQIPQAWSDDRTCAPEWHLPSTHLDRGLALWNLRQAHCFHTARLALARRYHENLEGVEGVTRPEPSSSALSHYTVRLDAARRNRIKQRLWQDGVYTISLWTFPPHLDRERFPNTFRLSSEVINLPLSPWMSPDHVDQVCERLRRAVRFS